jgi:hypothetical protein
MPGRLGVWSRVCGVAVMAAAVGVACSGGGGSCTTVLGPGQTIVGNYDLVSYAISGTTIPGTTGTLALTANEYNIALSNLVIGTVRDSGTYTLSCNRITQHSFVPNGPALSGTFDVRADTLFIVGTVSGVQQSLVWLYLPAP